MRHIERESPPPTLPLSSGGQKCVFDRFGLRVVKHDDSVPVVVVVLESRHATVGGDKVRAGGLQVLGVVLDINGEALRENVVEVHGVV